MSSNHKSFSSNHSIIVIDDEMELASLFKTFLLKVGFDAKSFTDPIVALDYFEETVDKHSL
jgi:DNA-binding response OmpR family regulator